MKQKFDWHLTPDGKGKIAIVTGSNVGLGFETAKVLAQKNYTVILACRKQANAEEAMESIRTSVPEADLHFMELDLASLASVRRFADSFKSQYQRLDLLINNAGVMFPPYQKTTDGFELQMGVNYLAHFLLTGLLVDSMAATTDSRVVTLSSIAHQRGEIHFDDMQFEKKYEKSTAYGQSKLACLMFAYELQRKLDANKIEVSSLASHPGVSWTNLVRHFPKWLVVISKILLGFMAQSAERGALPTLRAALDPLARGGEYYGPNGFRELKGDPEVVRSNELSYNEEVARRLWDVSEELTAFKFADQLKQLATATA